MKYTAGLLAIAAAAPSVLAIELTNSDYSVVAGEDFTLTWTNATGSVTVTLKDGTSTDLKDVEVLASGVTGDSYTWTPSSSLTSDTYAFEIEDSNGDINYSPQFEFEGAAASASSTAASSTAVSSTVSSSADSSTITSASSTATDSASASDSTSGTASADSTSSDSSASASATSDSSASSTLSTSTTKKTSTASATDSSSSSSSTSTPVSTNDSKMLGSPLALVLGTVISLALFN